MFLTGFIFPIIFLICALAIAQSSKADIDAEYAIINVPIANLREKPSHTSELVDQEIMGYSVKILNRDEDWLEVKTEYGYTGWMTDKSVVLVDQQAKEKWQQGERIIITKIFASIYSLADDKSEPVSSLVLNCLLKKIEKINNQWSKVELPDGRTGFLENKSFTEFPVKKLSDEKLRDAIIKTAKSMMGVPYLWGGKSSVACDCSGFVHIVFRANGISLLRDAKQQVTQGETVEYDENYSNVLPGDLLFFGIEKINHVAISLGGAEFIHQSGDVHINSLDPKAANYSRFYRKNLRAIRRIATE